MKTRFSKLMAVITMALLVSAPAAFAGGSHGGHWGKDDLKSKFFYKAKFILSHAEELGLSEEQKTGIEDLKYTAKKELIRQNADVEILALDIKRLLKERAINTEEVNKLIDQKYELKKEKAKYLVGVMAQLKQSLSDDQYQQMKDLKSGKGYSHKEMKKA